MSHLISTYAAAAGLRIDKPSVLSSFVPLPFARYITLQTGAGQAPKCYDYWQEVLVMLAPHLAPREIAIVHLGGKDDPPLQGVHDMRGKTTIAQSHYLIQNSLLHVGNDSWLVHCAGWNRRPLVALYGSTSVENHGPYWSDPARTILLSSHRGGGVPTYSSQENPKTINWIPPETVANAILSLLDISHRFTQETRLIGMLYNHVLFDVVPNSFPASSFLPDAAMTVRMDILHDEKVLANLLITGRKVNILTRRPIDLNLLNQFKGSILSYIHEIDEQCPIQYCGMLGGIIKHSSFFTKEKDDQRVADLRFKFFDVCTIQRANDLTREDYLNAAMTYTNQKGDEARARLEGEIKDGRLSFKSNHYLLSDGKIYLSQAHLKEGKAAPDFGANQDKVIDVPELWRDLNHFIVSYQPTTS